MRLRILPKEEVPRMVQALLADYRVVGPKAKGPKFVFEPIADPSEMRLDYNITILPPKVALQPPQERVAKIDLDGEVPQPEPLIEAEPTVIFGAHTCDIHALRLLDRAFAADYPDNHYLKRRQQTLIISLECLEPCDEHSFCKDMGTLTADEGYDLHLTDIGDAYTVHIGTEAGEALLEKYATTRAATDDDVRRLNEVLSAKWPRFTHRLNFDAAELPALLATAYEHPIWAELGERCLSCGSCTNVCPTCYCFNMLDTISLTLKEALRIRRWDSCQLDEFARVAGGENFREARAARQRHRFFRKGKWLRERFDTTGCVGCGRCIRTCLVNINIVEVFNTIHGSA
ncbi:MAG TPA: Ni/Fe hydrogenase subunit beta [Anaerolineales bacterium]|nr:Ni/Fe hydrogenase subunit beta [Anaerolineae bacterium]HIP87449.1 Ni/Fe hydrogenase subunit beta [Anaerolineales bacterium]